jgi:hypothetical protein
LGLLGVVFFALFFAFEFETFSDEGSAPAPSGGVLNFAFSFTWLEALVAPAFEVFRTRANAELDIFSVSRSSATRPDRDCASNMKSRRYPAFFAA